MSMEGTKLTFLEAKITTPPLLKCDLENEFTQINCSDIMLMYSIKLSILHLLKPSSETTKIYGMA